MKKIIIYIPLFLTLVTSGCFSVMGTDESIQKIFTPAPTSAQVTYNGNGFTAGAVPVDATVYAISDTVTVLTKGTLVKIVDGINLRFTGWNTAAGGGGTPYAAGATFSITASVTLYAQWEVIGGTGPGGGLVFYDKGSVTDGWRYLEVQPTDSGSYMVWSNILTTNFLTTASVGSGRRNSYLIAKYPGHTVGAATTALASSFGGFTDWFLPSRDELNLIYINAAAPGLGTFSTNAIWSSSEFSATAVWVQFMHTGMQGNSATKDASAWIRPVRAFRTVLPTWIAYYHGNSETGGTAPVNPYHFENTESVTIAANTGSLVKTGFTFGGWNSLANGTGTNYVIGNNYLMTGNLVLYAKWLPLFSRWTFDNTDADISGNSDTLSAVPAPVADNPKSLTNSGSWNGGSVTTTNTTDPGTGFSVSVWVKFNDLSGGSGYYTIIANAPSGSTSNGFKIFANSAGELIIETGDGGSTDYAGSSAGVVTTGVWYHIVAAMDSTTGLAAIYVNNVQVTTNTSILTGFARNGIFQIGAMTDSSHYIYAYMSDMRIYKSVLSPTDVQMIYNEP